MTNFELDADGQNMSVTSYDKTIFDSKSEKKRRTAKTPKEEEALSYLNKQGKTQVRVKLAKKV